jgi:protein ImuB
MLAHPEPLAVRDGHPLYQGLLVFEDGPERLETGWWDEDGIARDYFIAANPKGVRLWIYRNRSKDNGWYLHGIFG